MLDAMKHLAIDSSATSGGPLLETHLTPRAEVKMLKDTGVATTGPSPTGRC